MEYYSALQKEFFSFVATCCKGGKNYRVITLNEISETEEDKYNTISLICRIKTTTTTTTEQVTKHKIIDTKNR